jgi:hypothetical protein
MGLAVIVGVAVREGVAVMEGVGVTVPVGVGSGLSTRMMGRNQDNQGPPGVRVAKRVGVSVGDCVCVAVGVSAGVGVCVAVGVAVVVRKGDGVRLGVRLGDSVRVGVGDVGAAGATMSTDMTWLQPEKPVALTLLAAPL